MSLPVRTEVVEHLRHWLMDVAFPYWANNGVDRVNGGFVESLNIDGRDSGAQFKRTRVTARQIYVFAQSHELGWDGAREIVQHGVDHLLGKAWISDEAGFARRVSREGVVIDPMPDLYDLSFALFAISWAYRVTGQADLREWARRTLNATEHLLRDTEGLGFWHDADREGWRQQNPHMHLLEASLAAFESFGEACYADLAKEMVSLFDSHFWDREHDVLPEFFDRNWMPAPSQEGEITEPGHQFEWAWIFHNCNRLIQLDRSEMVRTLYKSAEARGFDGETGLTYNQVSRAGKVLDGGSRTWPNTERIKAAVALYEQDGIDPAPAITASANALMKHHLAHTPAGTWIDDFDASAVGTSSAIPSSTLYHVVLAFAEVLRISQ